MSLPTVAQWERGARGGTQSIWWTGSAASSLEGAANVLDERREEADSRWGFPEGDFDDGYVYLAPVATFRANPFGLFDVHGNVAEWCVDAYDDPERRTMFAKREANGGDDRGEDRVIRGGSFTQEAWQARLSYLDFETETNRHATAGVRPARDLE